MGKCYITSITKVIQVRGMSKMSKVIKVTQGKITIPKEMRKKYGIEDGDELVIEDNGGELVLKAPEIGGRKLEAVE